MTVRDLQDMLGTLDGDATLTMRTADGNEREITDAREIGNHLVLETDSGI